MSSPGDDIRNAGRAVWYGLLTVVVILVIAFIWTSGFGLWSKATAEQRGETGVREGTQASGQYRIARYDEFFTRCNAIVALGGQISDQKAVENPDSIDKQNLTALRNQYRQQASTYNASASAAGTSGQFRDSRLPAQIDPNPDTSGAVRCN